MQQIAGKKALFLSTLSLRRATRLHPERYWQAGHFYPRSPCGERHHVHVYMGISMQISIHALLAESDLVRKIARSAFMIFLSTLSLRRATGCSCAVRCRIGISIHALLAESDKMDGTDDITDTLFLSTLSLRRATRGNQR